MLPLHNESEENSFIPKAEQSGFLCSNKTSDDCSALDLQTEQTEDEVLIDSLACMLVEMFLEAQENNSNVEECSNLLPSLN